MIKENGSEDYDYDVVICGAGPTGLIMALGLADADIKVLLLNKHASRGCWARATNVWPRNIESIYLYDRDLYDTFAKSTAKVTHWAIAFDDRYYMQIPIWGVYQSKVAPLAWHLPQSETEQILEDYIRGLPDAKVDIRSGWSLDQLAVSDEQGGINLTITEVATQTSHKIRTRYLLGCDGTKSFVRTATNIPFKVLPKQYGSWVADGKVSGVRRGPGPEIMEPPMPQKLCLLFTRDVFAGFFPLKEDGVRVALSVPLEMVSEDKNGSPSAEDFNARLAGLKTHFLLKVCDIQSLSSTRFWFALCQSFSDLSKRIWVAGDAAHVHSPVGGQGMNLGMQEAFNLSWKLRMCLKHRYLVNANTLLTSYELERRPIAETIVWRTYFSTIAAYSKLPRLLWWFYATFVHLTYRFAMKRGVRLLSQLSYDYCKSPLCSNDWQRSRWYRVWDTSGVKAGKFVPFTHVSTTSNPSVYLASLCCRDGFTLFYFPPMGNSRVIEGDSSWSTFLQALPSYKFRSLISKIIIIMIGSSKPQHDQQSCRDVNIGEGQKAVKIEAVTDIDSRMHFVGSDSDESSLYVIRPDYFIGYRSRPLRLASLVDWFSKFT